MAAWDMEGSFPGGIIFEKVPQSGEKRALGMVSGSMFSDFVPGNVDSQVVFGGVPSHLSRVIGNRYNAVAAQTS
jgi:hypothetical protein